MQGIEMSSITKKTWETSNIFSETMFFQTVYISQATIDELVCNLKYTIYILKYMYIEETRNFRLTNDYLDNIFRIQ